MLYCLTILLHYLSRRLRPQSWTWWAYSLINQSFRLISEYANYLPIYPGHFVLRAVNYHVPLGLLVVQRLIIIDKWFLNSGYYIGSWELNVPTKNDGTKYWHTMEPYEVYLPLASRLELHVMLTVLALPVYWQWVLRLSHSSPTYHKRLCIDGVIFSFMISSSWKYWVTIHIHVGQAHFVVPRLDLNISQKPSSYAL